MIEVNYQLDCATSWIQASYPTTDFIHECDYLGWDDFPPPFPFPDGSGIMGFRDGRVRDNVEAEPNWKEYAGACLINPLLKGIKYRFQFDVGFVDNEKSPLIDITFFGTSNCDNLPFGGGDRDFGCPSNSPQWALLDKVEVAARNRSTWVNTFIEITPDEDIYAIAIGPDCPHSSSIISTYYFFDNLILADLESFNVLISEVGHPCSEDFALSIPFNSEFEYQWYLSGVALVGETFPNLEQHYGEGDYQVRIKDNLGCRLSTSFQYKIPIINNQITQSICFGESYKFGNLQLTESGGYLDTFKNVHNCDSIVSLELDIIGQTYDTIEASLLAGETLKIQELSFQEEGDYPLVLQSTLGCDSLLFLQLKIFDVYIPNCFSPDGDGIDDLFHPFTAIDELAFLSIKIYDRWGKLIYDGAEWDGSKMDSGVYTYFIDMKFTNGNSKTTFGNVTLFR